MTSVDSRHPTRLVSSSRIAPIDFVRGVIAACVVSLIREGQVDSWLFGNHPLNPPPVPHGYTWSRGLLYLVFAVCVIALYFPCRWFAALRATRRSRWLSYL